MATPNMDLTLPTVSVTVGPTYATQINTALTSIDSHNHTTGFGARVPTAGLNINADLEFNGNDATELRSTRYVSQGSVLVGVLDTSCLYVVSGNLYYNNSAGTSVQITSGSAINATAIGGIGGDYTSSTASVFYTNSTKTFSFWQASNTSAKMDVGDIILRKTTASSAGITIKAPTALASAYTIELPAAAPASSAPLVISSTGVVTVGTVGFTLTQSVSNAAGIGSTGNGTGAGLVGTGGATGVGVLGTGGATSGTGVQGAGVGASSGVSGTGGNTNGTGVSGLGGSTNGVGVWGDGTGSGTGVKGVGGTSGVGVLGTGGSASGTGVQGQGAGASPGVLGTGGATNGVGVWGIGIGSSEGVKGVGGATGIGVTGTGGATSGIGVTGQGVGASSGVSGTGGASNGTGVSGLGGATNGVGVWGDGTGSGSGVKGVGGASGIGVEGSSTTFGVQGTGTGAGGVGVKGVTATATAIVAQATGAGRPLRLVPQATLSSGHAEGDMWVEDVGSGNQLFVYLRGAPRLLA